MYEAKEEKCIQIIMKILLSRVQHFMRKYEKMHRENKALSAFRCA